MEPRAGECDESLEVGFEFFVPRGEASKVFESGEASFDAIALLVQYFVVHALLFAVAFGRDDGGRSHADDVLNYRIAVIALISQHGLSLALCQQADGLGAVVDLTGSHGEVHRQAQLIGEQMDLGR
jgi:hypothetical protein